MLLSVHIDVDCRIRAGALVRASVCTSERSAFRSVLLLEEVERSVCSDGEARLVNDPSDDVEVVAGLGKDDRCGGLLASPVASYV